MHRLRHFFQRQIAVTIGNNIFAGFIHHPQIHAVAIFQHVIQKLIQRFHHPAFNIALLLALIQPLNAMEIKQSQLDDMDKIRRMKSSLQKSEEKQTEQQPMPNL